MTITSTIEYYNGSTWVDLSSVYIAGSVKWSMGLMNASPTDRVGMPGNMTFDINNVSPYAYSPDSGSKATGWDIGTKVRVKLTDGSNTRYWLYRINTITVQPGEKGPRRVTVSAADYLEELNSRKITGLTVQLDKRADELLTTLIAQMPFAPENTSYGTGLYIHPYSFAEEQDETTVCMTILQKIAQSGMCYIYVDGDSTDGETLVLEAPEARYRVTSSATFDNAMIDMSPRRDRRDIFNKAKTTITPVSVADTVAVIGKNDEIIELEPQETKVITIRYVDEGTGRRVTALEVVTPVSGTDYVFYDMKQNDITGDLTVTPADNGNNMSFTLANGSTTKKGYIPKERLQVRGKIASTYNKQDIESSNSTSITAYGESTLSFVLPYTNNAEIAKTVASELVNRHKDPHTQISSMKYNANRSATFTTYALTLGIGKKITITEPVISLSSATYFINGCEYELLADGIVNVTYILERDYGAGNTYFVIGTSEWGGPDIFMPL